MGSQCNGYMPSSFSARDFKMQDVNLREVKQEAA